MAKEYARIFSYMREASAAKDLSSGHVRVLNVLLMSCGPKGYNRYSIEKLSKACGLSASYTRAITSDLCNRGILERDVVPGRSNYWVIPAVENKSDSLFISQNKVVLKTTEDEPSRIDAYCIQENVMLDTAAPSTAGSRTIIKEPLKETSNIEHGDPDGCEIEVDCTNGSGESQSHPQGISLGPDHDQKILLNWLVSTLAKNQKDRERLEDVCRQHSEDEISCAFEALVKRKKVEKVHNSMAYFIGVLQKRNLGLLQDTPPANPTHIA